MSASIYQLMEPKLDDISLNCVLPPHLQRLFISISTQVTKQYSLLYYLERATQLKIASLYSLNPDCAYTPTP